MTNDKMREALREAEDYISNGTISIGRAKNVLELITDALTQQPESEPVGEFTAETTAALTFQKTGNFVGRIYPGTELKAGDKLYKYPQPTPQVPDAETIANRVEQAIRPGPFCRDCADHGGRCPSSGELCDSTERAEELADAVRNLGTAPKVPDGFSIGRSPYAGDTDIRVEYLKPNGGHMSAWVSRNSGIENLESVILWHLADSLLTAAPSIAEERGPSMGWHNETLLLIDRVLDEVDSGFVACSTCGDQEDTKDLDFVDDLRRLKVLLYAILARPAGGDQ